MTAVLRCDGCGVLAGESQPIGWLQIRRYKEEDERRDWLSFGTSDRFEFVGHCCSVRCLANLALAQNDYVEKEGV